jgi:hypothetical protein
MAIGTRKHRRSQIANPTSTLPPDETDDKTSDGRPTNPTREVLAHGKYLGERAGIKTLGFGK